MIKPPRRVTATSVILSKVKESAQGQEGIGCPRPIYLSTFSMGLPLASSSTSLSSQRIFCISGSSTFSTLTPHTTPLIRALLGWMAGASSKNAP